MIAFKTAAELLDPKHATEPLAHTFGELVRNIAIIERWFDESAKRAAFLAVDSEAYSRLAADHKRRFGVSEARLKLIPEHVELFRCAMALGETGINCRSLRALRDVVSKGEPLAPWIDKLTLAELVQRLTQPSEPAHENAPQGGTPAPPAAPEAESSATQEPAPKQEETPPPRPLAAPLIHDPVEATCAKLGRATEQIRLIRHLVTCDKRQASFEQLVKDFYRQKRLNTKLQKQAERRARRRAEHTRGNLDVKRCVLRIHISGNVARLVDAPPS